MLAPVLFTLLSAAVDPEAATLSKTRLPAQGAPSTILTVKRFGRFAITAKSKQGASLTLVDRASGPGPSAGKPGGQDGRLDVFLDRGDFKIIARGAETKDTIEVTAHAFKELNADEKTGAKPPMLVEVKAVEDTLADFEQRSYWIDLAERRTVSIEAAGRSLEDLRLFKDGIWLVDAAPSPSRAEPKPTQPLRVLQLTLVLEPGLYLLSAFGGPKEPWSEENGKSPFYLRWGVPKLPEAGRKHFNVGPLGYDRYLIPNATFYRLELPEAKPATLSVGGQVATIAKNTIPPVAELAVGNNALNEVKVTAEAGQSYILQTFDSRHRQYLSKPGNYYVSTITAGHAEDSLDTTAVAVAYNSGSDHIVPAESAVVELDSKTPWIRRFNLLATATVFFHVNEAGTYQLTTGGTADATFRMEPLFINPPPNYRVPAMNGTPNAVKLDPGYWVLTLSPGKKGILEVVLSRQLTRIPSFAAADRSTLPLPGMRVPSISIPYQGGYWIWMNDQPGVSAGLLVRPLPLDLREPIYALQDPKKPLRFDFHAQEAGTLRAEAEDGTLLPISVDDREDANFVRLTPGTFKVTVHTTGEHLVPYSLGLTPRTLEKDTPLPQVPDARFAALPDFPVLTPKTPHFLSLERESSSTFLLHASKPGLYRVESTGLLETSGNLRARMITSLSQNAANGVGRNFLLEQYLGTGDYQVTVATQGLTRGRLGVVLGETRVIQGGALRDGIVARTTLTTGSAAIFPFEITHTGTYHLSAIAPGRTIRARIEDGEGWPLLTPGGPADAELALEPEKYRLVALPEPVEVRVLALLEEVREGVRFAGKGPHRLPFDTEVEHTWLEIGRGEARKADVFVFELPARAELNIALSETMRAELVRIGGIGEIGGIGGIGENKARERVGTVARGSWQGVAEKGDYQLEVVCLHQDDGVDYDLAVRPTPMVAGISRELSAPVVVPIAIGDQRAVEISSFGAADVRARLIDSTGRVIAESDDRPDDWNFLIAARVAPGNYRLAIDPVGGNNASTVVTMTARAEVPLARASLPFAQKIRLGDEVRLIPFDRPVGPLLAVSASSEETIGVSLEAEVAPNQWKTIAISVGRPAKAEALALDGAAAKSYRARVWSADRRGLPASVSIAAIEPRRVSESELAVGITVAGASGAGVAAVSVELERPGTLRMIDASEGSVRAASLPGDTFEALDRQMARAETTQLFLVRDLDKNGDAGMRAERVRLAIEPTAIDLPADRGSGIRSVFADLPNMKSGAPLLVEAEAIGSGIGVAFGAKTRELAQVAVRDRSAIAVALAPPEAPLARIWPLDQPTAPVEARIRALSFELPGETAAKSGLSVGSLSKRTATSLSLPAGAKRVRLTLEDGAVAALANGERVERVFWADGGEEVLETSAQRLLILNPTERERGWSIEVVAETKTSGSLLGERAPYEALRPLAGVLRLDVAEGSALRTIHVRGEVESALYLGTGGASARGEDLPIDGRAGVLYLRTKPGLVVAWIDGEKTRGRALFGDVAATSAHAVSGTALLPLEGKAASFKVTVSEPTILHLRTDVPVVSRISRGYSDRYAFHPQGAAIDAYVPKGTSEVALRALLGGVLSGAASFTTSPIAEIREGLGPEVMLSPGTMRVFRFHVEETSAIGIGVRSDSDAVEAVLMDSTGKELTRGVIDMINLAKGDYLLGLRTPETAAPARARPALAGTAPPQKGPPPEIVREYIEN